MGLIDLKTDLKSLRYGKDTIGGGYSGQPYIQTLIPESFNDLGANEDFILRGGINAVRDSVTDIRRLTKMFFDLKSPNGLLFIAKQNVLSNAAVRTQTSGVINEGIYTPLNTLAEAGVVAFGGHLNKQGINPFKETGAYANNPNLYYVKVKTDQLTEFNRLARLYQLISTNASDELDGFILNNGNVLTYNGGPNSILGVGKTNIRFPSPEQRTGKQNKYFTNNPNFFYGKNNQKTVNIDNKQVGGLQVDSEKLWTKSPQYLLPDFNVNSPQSSSLSNIPYGQLTWTAKQNITGSNIVNGQFSRYNPLLTGISGVNSVYDKILSVTDVELKSRDSDGNIRYSNNVHISGTLDPNTEVTQGHNIQKTVNVDKEQVGGLKIDPLQPWTWNGPKIVTPYTTYNIGNGLPAFDVNKPQSASLTSIPKGPFKDESKSNITSPNGAIYLDQVNNVGGATNKYKTLTDQSSSFTGSILVGNKLKPNWESNVYTQGNTFPGNSPVINNNGTYVYNQQDIINQENNFGKNSYSPSIQDFRKVLRNSKNLQKGLTVENAKELGQLTDAPNYIDYNIGKNNLIGNPGQRSGKNYSSYTKGVTGVDGGSLDKINAAAVGTDLSNDDLVQFRIQSLFPEGQTLAFRAFLGTFTDNYSSTINTQQYVGRGENFYTYGGQTRKISLSWTVAALSKQELIPMYKRLSYLAGMTAPKYVDGFMQGPLVNLTVGGYIYNLPGYIEGFSLSLEEDSSWEIAINDAGEPDNNTSQLTHIVKVSGFNFTPIPNYLPETGARFISIVNRSGTEL